MTCIKQILMCSYVNDAGFICNMSVWRRPQNLRSAVAIYANDTIQSFLLTATYIEQACRWLTEHSVMSIKSKKLDRNANVIQINMQMNENVKGKCAGEALFN